MMGQRIRRRRGLTLLELILALALTTLILLAISMAINVNLRAFNSRAAEIENAQLARAVLRLIADDLRGAIEETATDFSGVEANSMTDDVEEAAGELGIGDALFADDEATESADDIASATTLPAKMGLYGNQFQIQVDVSRLPRPDEYFAALSASDEAGYIEIPTDIKTVAYYIQQGDDANTAAAGLYGPSAVGAGMLESGLVRRALDRSVTQYATDSGDTQILTAAGEVVAPEVTSIEFLYFDGLEWVAEWDSEEMQALPAAVKVLIAIRKTNNIQAANAMVTPGVPGTYGENDVVFEQVIALPMAKPPPTETDEFSELGL